MGGESTTSPLPPDRPCRAVQARTGAWRRFRPRGGCGTERQFLWLPRWRRARMNLPADAQGKALPCPHPREILLTARYPLPIHHVRLLPAITQPRQCRRWLSRLESRGIRALRGSIGMGDEINMVVAAQGPEDEDRAAPLAESRKIACGLRSRKLKICTCQCTCGGNSAQ